MSPLDVSQYFAELMYAGHPYLLSLSRTARRARAVEMSEKGVRNTADIDAALARAARGTDELTVKTKADVDTAPVRAAREADEPPAKTEKEIANWLNSKEVTRSNSYVAGMSFHQRRMLARVLAGQELYSDLALSLALAFAVEEATGGGHDK